MMLSHSFDQPTGAVLRFRDELDACPACGAHRWEQTQAMLVADVVRCGECANDQRVEDVRSVLVGRD